MFGVKEVKKKVKDLEGKNYDAWKNIEFAIGELQNRVSKLEKDAGYQHTYYRDCYVKLESLLTYLKLEQATTHAALVTVKKKKNLSFSQKRAPTQHA